MPQYGSRGTRMSGPPCGPAFTRLQAAFLTGHYLAAAGPRAGPPLPVPFPAFLHRPPRPVRCLQAVVLEPKMHDISFRSWEILGEAGPLKDRGGSLVLHFPVRPLQRQACFHGSLSIWQSRLGMSRSRAPESPACNCTFTIGPQSRAQVDSMQGAAGPPFAAFLQTPFPDGFR